MAKAAKQRIRGRGLIQLLFAALTNSFVTGFAAGKIYQGNLKHLCHPGLNCYSCPGAVLSCPIGALQAVIGSRAFHLSLYVMGFLLLVGATLGRFVCGFLCPFGMIQEWLYKIPFPWKRNRFRGDAVLRYVKYALLVVLVIALPMLLVNDAGAGSPTFCKYVCPAGTLEGAVPLVLLSGKGPQTPTDAALPAGPLQPQALPGLPAGQPILQGTTALPGIAAEPVYRTGALFNWKMTVLALVILLSVATYRPFCKYLCPLGAIYGMLNPVALYRLRMEDSLCIHCGRCRKACLMCLDPEHRQNQAECVRCGDCVNACPTGALSMGFGEKKRFGETAGTASPAGQGRG